MNVVHGAKDAVDALLRDPRVRAVSFVGSSPVAKYIYETASKNGKRVQCLAGAKNHSVVMPDCDMKATVDSVMASSFGCAGERCVATSVVVAVGDAGDAVVSELKKAASALNVGPGDEKGITMGPIINPEAKKRILSYIDIGEKEVAKLARAGERCGSVLHRNESCDLALVAFQTPAYVARLMNWPEPGLPLNLSPSTRIRPRESTTSGIPFTRIPSNME